MAFGGNTGLSMLPEDADRRGVPLAVKLSERRGSLLALEAGFLGGFIAK